MNELLNDVLLLGKSESGTITINATRIALTNFARS